MIDPGMQNAGSLGPPAPLDNGNEWDRSVICDSRK